MLESKDCTEGFEPLVQSSIKPASASFKMVSHAKMVFIVFTFFQDLQLQR